MRAAAQSQARQLNVDLRLENFLAENVWPLFQEFGLTTRK
jgi:hypothetical protein